GSGGVGRCGGWSGGGGVKGQGAGTWWRFRAPAGWYVWPGPGTWMSKMPDPEVPTSVSRSPSNPVGGLLVPSGGLSEPNSADAGNAKIAIAVKATSAVDSLRMVSSP